MPDRRSGSSEPSRPENVGRTGARFPSGKQLDKLGEQQPEQDPRPRARRARRRRPSGGVGARFPSAKHLERLDRAAGLEQSELATQSEQAAQAEPAAQPELAAQTDQADQAARAGQTGHAGQAAQAGQSDETGHVAHAEEPVQASQTERLEPGQPAAEPPEPEHSPDPGAEGAAEPVGGHTMLVRPYVLTSGRTSSATAGRLALETLLTASGSVAPETISAEHRAARELCARPHSVAEVAALLSLPVGVARVLLADLADAGLVMVHERAYQDSPDMALLQRVLRGLREL